MPKTKDGGFLLDDSSCTPYTNMFNKEYGKDKKQNKQKNTPKKTGVGKKK